MKVLILCGGRGIRLFGESTYILKGMVRLGHRPILWHIMKRFALAGHTDFVLALGLKGEMIREYFLNYDRYVNDVTIMLGSGKETSLSRHQEERWNITFVDTGENANSGARIHRCKQYIEGDDFFITYSDTLGDIHIPDLVKFHKNTGKMLRGAAISIVHHPRTDDVQAYIHEEQARLLSLLKGKLHAYDGGLILSTGETAAVSQLQRRSHIYAFSDILSLTLSYGKHH